MNNTNDKRVLKTFANLRRAFTEYLMDHNFDDLTVNDLCEMADIRRATFYMHFKDKMDFTRYVIYSLHKALGESIQASASENACPCTFLMQYVKNGIALMASRNNIFANISESSAFPTICALVAECTTESLRNNIEAARAVGLTLPADIDVTAAFVNAGITYTVLNWLRKRPPPSPSLYEELEKLLKKIFECEKEN